MATVRKLLVTSPSYLDANIHDATRNFPAHRQEQLLRPLLEICLLTRFAGSLSRRSTGSKSVIGELAIKLHRVAKDRRQHTLACNR